MPITVKTPVYEGPLELLLELIEKRKLLINDISLAGVAEEYVARVKAMGELPVGETAEFLSLAATLLLIKSRSLLPNLTLTDEETRDIKELEYRLAVFQLLKEAGGDLAEHFRHAPMLFEGVLPEPEPLFIPDESLSVEALRAAARTLIDGFPTTLTLPEARVKKIVSIEEMIERLASRVSSALTVSFHEFSKFDKRDRGEVIIGFLALLELVKQGIIRATQEKKFGDIMLEADAISTPTYE
jgi:segregation and condensation protein A